VLTTARTTLEPLTADHAEEMAPLLDDPALYAFTGGRPLGLDELRRRYERLARGHSSERWLNWIVRRQASGEPVGTVQATVRGGVAELAWVIAVPYQGHGYATEAAAAMAVWLREQGVAVLAANIAPGHEASARVARALGLAPSDELVEGEVRWLSAGG
jgi:RimJ/RimL family protein N-acetyltransferase